VLLEYLAISQIKIDGDQQLLKKTIEKEIMEIEV
jgi:hypothetical protein